MRLADQRPWRGTSDTEVLLRALEVRGVPSALRDLNGGMGPQAGVGGVQKDDAAWIAAGMEAEVILLDIGLPGEAVFASDRVADTIDYEQVALRIKALAAIGHFRLVETLAERVARLLMDDFGAPWVKVSAAKIGSAPAE